MGRPRERRRAAGAGSASAGLTLVEFALVLVILGILTAVGAPRFFSRSGFSESFFHQDVLSALRYGQKLAVASGCDVRVTITATDYVLAQRTACQTGAFTRPVVAPGTGEASFGNTAPAGVTLSSTVSPIIFDALGRARDATLAVVDATVTAGARQVLVSGETGFVYDPAG